MEERESLEEERRSLAQKDLDATEVAGFFGRAARFFSKEITGQVVIDTEETNLDPNKILKQQTVDFGEWERFLAGDSSSLQYIYQYIEFEYLTLPSFLLLYKIAVVVPTVFITDLFWQIAVSGCVEVFFGVFIFWSEPYVSPWVDTMYRAGSVHNIALIGLGSINVMLVRENSLFDLAIIITLVTVVYFCFVVGLLFGTVIWPTIATILTKMSVQRHMLRIGMRTIELTSLFLNPLIHSEEKKNVKLNIPSTYEAYQKFIVEHPTARPGDDVTDIEARRRDEALQETAVQQAELVAAGGAHGGSLTAVLSPTGGNAGVISSPQTARLQPLQPPCTVPRGRSRTPQVELEDNDVTVFAHQGATGGGMAEGFDQGDMQAEDM